MTDIASTILEQASTILEQASTILTSTILEQPSTILEHNNSIMENDWIIELEEETKNPNLIAEVENPWKTTTIYRVPPRIKKQYPEAYTPTFISLGPYHHGDEGLENEEHHKRRALRQFVRRAEPVIFRTIVNEVAKLIPKLRDSYSCLDNKWDDVDAFLRMMITDAIFVIEALEFNAVDGEGRGYSELDPFFSAHGLAHNFPHLRRDMLIMENQIPLFLLKALLPYQSQRFEVMEERDKEKYINSLVLDFLTQKYSAVNLASETTLGLHPLDLYRRCLLGQKIMSPPAQSTVNSTEVSVMRCAVELHEAGVHFTLSETQDFQDVGFNPKIGEFHLPGITVDDQTECNILNVIAFEVLHTNIDSDVTSYMLLMDQIIDSANDVRLLKDQHIIKSCMGSDKQVAKIFNAVMKDKTLAVTPDNLESKMLLLRANVLKYCGNKRNVWRANLCHTYFRTPWSAISLAGALIVIFLTFVGSLYAVLAYYK